MRLEVGRTWRYYVHTETDRIGAEVKVDSIDKFLCAGIDAYKVEYRRYTCGRYPVVPARLIRGLAAGEAGSRG